MIVKFLALSNALLFAGFAFGGSTGIYKVPAGAYMNEDVFLISPKVNVNEKPDGTLKLDYKLPKELDGAEPRNIRLKSVSAANPLQLVGPDGVAICEPYSREFSCTISYFPSDSGLFEINTLAAEQYMTQRRFSPAQIEQIKKSQQSIMHEAAGILFINL